MGEVSETGGIATDSAGNAYLTNQIRNAVQVYAANGTFVREFSIDQAVGDGRKSIPEGVTVDGSGRIFVADAERTTVLAFTSAGRFVRRVGGREIRSVGDLAVDDAGRIYAADPSRRKIHVFKNNGRFVRSIGGKSSLASLEGIDVAAAGDIYAVDWQRNRIRRFSPSGRLAATLKPADARMQPADVSVGANATAFVVDAHGFVVQILDANGNTTGSFSTVDLQSRIDLGPDGSVYVAQGTYNLATRYSAAGAQLATFGRHVDNPADVGGVKDIAEDVTGGVTVANEMNGTIELFNGGGTLVSAISGPAGPQGDAFSPRSLAINDAGGIAAVSVQDAAFPGDKDQYVAEFDLLGNLISNVRIGPYDEGVPLYKIVAYDNARTMTMIDLAAGAIESFTVVSGSLIAAPPKFCGRGTRYTTLAALVELGGDVIFANHKPGRRHVYRLRDGSGTPARIDRLGRKYRNWQYTDIAQDGSGNIYLLSRKKNRILKLGANGRLKTTIKGSSRSKPGSKTLGHVFAIAVAPDGEVFTADEFGVKMLSE